MRRERERERIFVILFGELSIVPGSALSVSSSAGRESASAPLRRCGCLRLPTLPAAVFLLLLVSSVSMANAEYGRSLAGERQLGRTPPRTMSPISKATPGPVREALGHPSRGRGAAAAQEAALFYQEQRVRETYNVTNRRGADELVACRASRLVDAEARIALLNGELSSAQSPSAPSTRLAAQMAEALEAVQSMRERSRVSAVDLSMAGQGRPTWPRRRSVRRVFNRS